MSAPALEPSMLVVCIKGADIGYRSRGGWAPKTGYVYTVRGYYHGPQWDQIYLEEYVHHETHPDGCEIGWMASRFRPLGKDRLSIFRQHLTGIPSKTKETA